MFESEAVTLESIWEMDVTRHMTDLTLAIGARQLVVQEALETTSMSGEYLSSLTPITNIGASPEGALITTWNPTQNIFQKGVFRRRGGATCQSEPKHLNDEIHLDVLISMLS